MKKFNDDDAVKMVREFHMKFFKYCSPGLLKCYDTLNEELHKKTKDILGEQERLVKSRKDHFLMNVDQSILKGESDLAKELATRHFAQGEIDKVYDSTRQRLFSGASAILGFSPSANLIKDLKKETDQRFSESQKKMEQRNKDVKEKSILQETKICRPTVRRWWHKCAIM